MLVITADQVDSRSGADRVTAALTSLNSGLVPTVLQADRTAGDELQVLVESGVAALDVILHLTRHGGWSVGCGAGSVSTPLPANIREATGGAFIAARRAVERAKKKHTKFAVEADPTRLQAATAESLIDLLLTLRARRSAEGWELHDLLHSESLTQAEAAQRLGISPQAVSLRARAAELRIEVAALPSLAHLLDELGNVEPTEKGEHA